MKATPKDFFLHLGVIVTLYVGAGSLINLSFKVIDGLFPKETLLGIYYNYSPISWPVATLIIVFPIFIVLSWLLGRDYSRMPEKRTLGIRKWLIYITLFVSGIVIASDLVYLIFRFLSGEIITTGFILKSIAVLVVAGFIFSYYIATLKEKVTSRADKIYAVVSGLVVLALIIAGFAIFGSPVTQRKLRTDSERINALNNIQWQIVNYWQQKQVLPENLDDLSDPISGFVAPLDPATGKSYEYKKLEALKFKLCATFDLESSKINQGREQYYPSFVDQSFPSMGKGNETWTHPAGRHCFERVIDPDIYPPRKTL